MRDEFDISLVETRSFLKEINNGIQKSIEKSLKKCRQIIVGKIISVSSNQRTATVRLPESPSDGSHDLENLLNKTGEVLSVDDEVYIEYFNNKLTNAYIAIRKGDAVPLSESEPQNIADNQSINSNGSNLLQIHDFNNADVGQVPYKTISNDIGWQTPIQRYIQTIVCDNSTTQYQINHNKGIKHVIVQIVDTNDEIVNVKTHLSDENYCTIKFPKPQSGRTYTVIVL